VADRWRVRRCVVASAGTDAGLDAAWRAAVGAQSHTYLSKEAPIDVFKARGLDRLLGALRALPGVVGESFGPQALLLVRPDMGLAQPRDPGRFQGDELPLACAVLDLAARGPVSPALIESAVLLVLKLEYSMHTFHAAHFPAAAGAHKALGCNVGARASSPLRGPLARLLAATPGPALAHFFSQDRLTKRTYSALLSDLLSKREACVWPWRRAGVGAGPGGGGGLTRARCVCVQRRGAAAGAGRQPSPAHRGHV
jgi:hypothetical protein